MTLKFNIKNIKKHNSLDFKNVLSLYQEFIEPKYNKYCLIIYINNVKAIYIKSNLISKNAFKISKTNLCTVTVPWSLGSLFVNSRCVPRLGISVTYFQRILPIGLNLEIKPV